MDSLASLWRIPKKIHKIPLLHIQKMYNNPNLHHNVLHDPHRIYHEYHRTGSKISYLELILRVMLPSTILIIILFYVTFEKITIFLLKLRNWTIGNFIKIGGIRLLMRSLIGSGISLCIYFCIGMCIWRWLLDGNFRKGRRRWLRFCLVLVCISFC